MVDLSSVICWREERVEDEVQVVSGHLQMTSTKVLFPSLGHLSPKVHGWIWRSLFYLMHACAKLLQLCWTLCNPMNHSPPGSSVHGDTPGKNIGVGCHALIQGFFLTQGSNWYLLCLLHWQVGSLSLSHSGSLFYLIGTLNRFRTLRLGIDKRGETKNMGNPLDFW